MADDTLLSILLYLYMIWGYTKMGVHQIKAPSSGEKSHGFAIPPNHLKAVPRYYHVISVATEVKLHLFRGRGTTAAMAVDLFFCSFPSPRKCQGSKFFFKKFLAAKALIICNSKPFEVYLFFHFRGSGSNLFFCSLPWSR